MQSGTVRELYELNRDRADFLFVYIREAHPIDSNWADSKANLKEPTTLEERAAASRTCCRELKLDMPTVVDELDDTVSMRYCAWPERIYIIGTDGRILYRNALGPFGFKPKEAGQALARLFSSVDDD